MPLWPRGRAARGREDGAAQIAALAVVLVVVMALCGLLALGSVLVQASAEAAGGGAPAELHPVFADAYGRASAAAPGHAEGCRIRPAVLAGLGRVEWAPGNSDGGAGVDVSPTGVVSPPVYGPPTPYGRAVGPMQFLPSTWDTAGIDAAGTPGGDGVADPHNIYDAALSAAVYLCRSVPGSPVESDEDLLAAFFAYNRLREYAEEVLRWVHHFDRQVAASVAAVGGADASDLLVDPRLILSPSARADLEQGNVDGRIVAALRGILLRHSVAISVFKTGHSKFVAGTDRVSNHYACDGCPGRAVDIYWVDGEDVSPWSAAAETLVRELIASHHALGIDEIGQPFTELAMNSPTLRVFADASHRGHIHVGVDLDP